MNNWNSGFLGGVLLGIVLGGMLAVLYAPEKGEKTRKKLVKKSGHWQGRASEALDTASDFVDKRRKKMGI